MLIFLAQQIYELEGAQRVHISAKWIFLQLLYRVGREMVPR